MTLCKTGFVTNHPNPLHCRHLPPLGMQKTGFSFWSHSTKVVKGSEGFRSPTTQFLQEYFIPAKSGQHHLDWMSPAWLIRAHQPDKLATSWSTATSELQHIMGERLHRIWHLKQSEQVSRTVLPSLGNVAPRRDARFLSVISSVKDGTWTRSLNDLEDFPYRDTASFGSSWSSSPRVMSQLSCLTYRTMELLRLENTSKTLSTSCPPAWQALLDSLLCDSDFQYHKVQYWTQYPRFSLLTEGKDLFMDLSATFLLVQSRESLTSWGT